MQSAIVHPHEYKGPSTSPGMLSTTIHPQDYKGPSISPGTQSRLVQTLEIHSTIIPTRVRPSALQPNRKVYPYKCRTPQFLHEAFSSGMQSTINQPQEYKGPLTSSGTQSTLIHFKKIIAPSFLHESNPHDRNPIEKYTLINAKHHNSYTRHSPQECKECKAQSIKLKNAKHYYSYTSHIHRNAKHNHSPSEIHSTIIPTRVTPS